MTTGGRHKTNITTGRTSPPGPQLPSAGQKRGWEGKSDTEWRDQVGEIQFL